MSTLHFVLHNGVDLYVKERQEVRHYRTKSAEERRRRRMPNHFTRCVRNIALNSDVIHSFNWKSAIEHDGGV